MRLSLRDFFWLTLVVALTTWAVASLQELRSEVEFLRRQVAHDRTMTDRAVAFYAQRERELVDLIGQVDAQQPTAGQRRH